MMINDLKELEKLFKICRKQGVTDITLGEITIKFGDTPQKVESQDEGDGIQTDALSSDELIYYAVQNQEQI